MKSDYSWSTALSLIFFYTWLAEGPGVALGKKNLEKKILDFFWAYVTPRPPLSVHKKFQPNRSSRLASYREHIYECLVLLYRLAWEPSVAQETHSYFRCLPALGRKLQFEIFPFISWPTQFRISKPNKNGLSIITFQFIQTFWFYKHIIFMCNVYEFGSQQSYHIFK